jgi:hypothetical protein
MTRLPQAQDDELQTLLVSNTTLQLKKILIPGTSVKLYCETTSGKPRPYIPSPLCHQVFNSLHSLSHPRIKAMAKLISQCFVWPAIQKDCRTWAQACQPCQRSKVSHHTVTPVGNFTLPPACFLHIHNDLVGPLLSSVGFQYCLTAVHRSHAGQKPSLCLTSQQRQCHVPCSLAGYHALVVHRTPPPTKEASLSHSCSTTWRSCAVPTSAG